MNSTRLTRRTAAMLMLASLSACGGGGGGSDDSGSTGGGGTGGGTGTGGGGTGTGGGTTDPGTGTGTGGGNTGGNTGGTTAVTGQYRLETAATSFASALATANQLGAQGYAYISTLAAGVLNNVTMGDFYVTDTAHKNARLDYVADAYVGSVTALVAQANQRGSQGYLYKAGAAFPSNQTDIRNLYVRDSSLSQTFTYEAVLTDNTTTTAKVLGDELTRMGARGFRWLGPMIIGTQMFNFYCKDNAGTTYEYTLGSMSGTYSEKNAAELKKALDAKGAEGRLTRGALALANGAGVAVWEKSSKQKGAIQYMIESDVSNDTLAKMKARLDTNAAKGFFFLTGEFTSDNVMHNISVSNATNMLHPLAGGAFPG